MKEFIYLDTDYLTSALAQINNGKIVSYMNEGLTTSEDETSMNDIQSNHVNASFSIPGFLGIDFGNKIDSENATTITDITSAKEIITKTFDDNAFDVLLQHIKEQNILSNDTYKEGYFSEIHGEYKLIDFDFLIMLLDKDFVDLYVQKEVNNSISQPNNVTTKNVKNNNKSTRRQFYTNTKKNLEMFRKLVPSPMLLYINNVLMSIKTEFLRNSFKDISFKYKKINILVRITRLFEIQNYNKDADMLLNAVDYMIPSILQPFGINIREAQNTYIATPIAIYI